MLARERLQCVACLARKRLISTTFGNRAEEKLKIEAEPPKTGSKNWIGPPDPVSNIRPIKFQIPADETSVERAFRQRQTETTQWNDSFWQKHNAKFFKEKADFVQKVKEETGQKATAEELSQFYRSFLNANRQSHLQYNRDWYKKNISMLWPALQVAAIRMVRRLQERRK